MVIGPPTASRFINAYMAFLGSLVSDEDKQGPSTTTWLVKGRERYAADRSLLDTYRAAQRKLSASKRADAEMLDAIARIQVGRWVHLKDTRAYSVVLDDQATQAYAVLGLTQRIRDTNNQGTGLVMEAALVPLNGHWVCDGLIKGLVSLGPNYRRSYTAHYQALRQSGRFSVSPNLSS